MGVCLDLRCGSDDGKSAILVAILLMSKIMQPFSVGAWHVHPNTGTIVRGELEKRLQPKVMEVLLSLVSRPGDLVTREELLTDVWGERAVSDEPLTRCIGELRSAFEDSAAKPRYIETLPKRGYRLIAPVAESEDNRQSVFDVVSDHGRSRSWVIWIIALMVLSAGIFLAWQFWPAEPSGPLVPPEPSLAVLPFENLSGSAEQEFLADGISATLTQVLSRDTRLKVVARTSAFAFKGRTADVREIGRQLGVNALLEGSVQRQRDTLRVTSQLVEVSGGTTIWSGAYDRPVDNLFELQDEIASEVAAALQLTLLDDEVLNASPYGARNFDAYLEYVRGLEALNQRTTSSLAFAISQFQSVAEMDPTFALAWVGLAEALLVNQWYADVPLDEALDQAAAALDKAAALEPKLGEVWSVMGLLEFKRANYEASERALKRAVALAPNNARAWFLYGTLLNDTGRPEEAIEKHRRSALLDPMAPVVLTAIGVSLEKLGRFEEASQQYQQATVVDAGYPAAYDRIGLLLWSVYGRPAEALAEHRTALSLDTQNTWTRTLVAEMAMDLVDPEMAETWVDAALETGGNKLSPNQSKALLMVFNNEIPAERLVFARRWLDDAFTYADLDTMLRLYRDAALELGQGELALELYRSFLPELFLEKPEITVALYGPAIDVALLMKNNGDHETAGRLLQSAWEVTTQLPRIGCCGFGLADVEVLALSGRADEAVIHLAEAYESGFRVRWWWETLHNPNLSSLKDNENYQSLLDRFKQRADWERKSLPLNIINPRTDYRRQ